MKLACSRLSNSRSGENEKKDCKLINTRHLERKIEAGGAPFLLTPPPHLFRGGGLSAPLFTLAYVLFFTFGYVKFPYDLTTTPSLLLYSRYLPLIFKQLVLAHLQSLLGIGKTSLALDCRQ